MQKWLATGFVGIGFICVAWSVSAFSKSLRNYTEPDPTKFDPSIIKSGLQSAGIEVDVAKVIYVNQTRLLAYLKAKFARSTIQYGIKQRMVGYGIQAECYSRTAKFNLPLLVTALDQRRTT